MTKRKQHKDYLTHSHMGLTLHDSAKMQEMKKIEIDDHAAKHQMAAMQFPLRR